MKRIKTKILSKIQPVDLFVVVSSAVISLVSVVVTH